jgi:hypothetical protein
MADFFDNVKPGSRVHYLTPQGQTRSGTVVMNQGTHLVLNRGGGQPQVVTPKNYIKHSTKGKVKGALLSNLAKSMKEERYRDNPQIRFHVEPLKHGALVMTDRGDVHDHYDSHEEARKAADKLNNDYGVRRWNKKRAAKEANEETRLDEISSKLAKSYLKKTDPNTPGAKEIDAHLDAVMTGKEKKMDPDIQRKAFNRVQGRANARDRKGLRGALRRRAIELGKQGYVHRDKFNKEETQLDELKTTTLKSYGRKALKDLPKQVKAGDKAWDKYVSGADVPDPDKAYDEIVKADRKVHNRKAGIKRLSKQLADRAKLKPEGERVKAMSLNTENTLEAQKTAIAYELTKKKKKKKKQVLKAGKKAASSVRPTNEAKSSITGREMAEYIPDGQGKYKVNYIYPDKSKKENDRFETRSKAEKYAADLQKKGYHDVHIGEESTAEIMDRVKKGNERSKALLAKVKKDRERRKYEIHGGPSKYSPSMSRGTGRPLGTLGIGEAKEDLPFEPDDPKKIPGVVKGKNPKGYSIARHLARMARDKAEKQKKMYAKEGYEARETEHSGAKKGKGAYYGRKKDAKKESNKARREADKKQCCDEAKGVVHGIGIHDDPARVARVRDVAKKKIIKKIHSAERDEKKSYGGWTGMKEERIDEIGPFHISKNPVGKKILKTVDKVLDKMADRSDARYQKKQDKIAKERYGKSWTEAGMKAPRKIDPTRQRYPDGSGPSNEEVESNFYNRLDEVSKDLLARYVQRASRQAADSQYSAGHAFGSTMQAHKSAARLQHGRPLKFAGKRRQLAYDAADAAEAPHMEKSRKRLKGISKAIDKLRGDDRYAFIPATNEGRESEYRANMQLAGTARKKPGHYLVRNGQHISGPHDPQGALNKYKDMGDNTGVKIVHIKEANKLQADVKKAGRVIQKALKKKKTANVEPELETPNQGTSQPALMGAENDNNSM